MPPWLQKEILLGCSFLGFLVTIETRRQLGREMLVYAYKCARAALSLGDCRWLPGATQTTGYHFHCKTCKRHFAGDGGRYGE